MGAAASGFLLYWVGKLSENSKHLASGSCQSWLGLRAQARPLTVDRRRVLQWDPARVEALFTGLHMGASGLQGEQLSQIRVWVQTREHVCGNGCSPALDAVSFKIQDLACQIGH